MTMVSLHATRSPARLRPRTDLAVSVPISSCEDSCRASFFYPQCPDTWPRSRGRRSHLLQTLEIGMERAIDHCAMYCSGTQHLLRCEKPSDYREHFFRCHRVDSCCRKERSKGLFTDVLHPTLAFERFELGGEFLAQIRSARGIRL